MGAEPVVRRSEAGRGRTAAALPAWEGGRVHADHYYGHRAIWEPDAEETKDDTGMICWQCKAPWPCPHVYRHIVLDAENPERAREYKTYGCECVP